MRAAELEDALAHPVGDLVGRQHRPLGRLDEWEQHGRDPDKAAQAYLRFIAREPMRYAAHALLKLVPREGLQPGIPRSYDGNPR